MTKRATLPKIPPVRQGMKRSYVACKKCGQPTFYDYVPFSLSTPMTTLPCGHGITVSWTQAVRWITKEKFEAIIAKAEGPTR